MTKFTPVDQSVLWDISRLSELCNGYLLLFCTGSSYEAYLFALVSQFAGSSGTLVGTATSAQEAFDLIEDSSGAMLLCLVSDLIGYKNASDIVKAAKKSNSSSLSFFIVNDIEKYHSAGIEHSIFNSCCSASSVGRGGLARCLEAVLSTGQSFLDPVLIKELGSIPESGLPPLTSREREIACLLAGGLTNKEIAARLFISDRTARDYVSSILEKLVLPNRAAAAAWALRHGLV